MSIILAIVCVFIIGFTGFLTARLLKIQDSFAVLGMTFVLGASVFLLLANALGYVLPLKQAFSTTVVLIAAFDLFAMRKVSLLWKIDRSEKKALWFLLALTGLVGLAYARYAGSDPWSWQHFPLASTIVSGNFPVVTPINPTQILAYHYAPAFTAAGFTLLTGLPLTFGFALQPLIGVAGILFFVAAFVRSMTSSIRTALIASVLALAGAGLMWLKSQELVALFQTFVLGQPQDHALRGIGNLAASPLTTSPLIFLGHRSTAMGFPLMYAVVWCLTEFLQGRRVPFIVLGFIFALALTLTMELAFATLAASLLAVAALYWLLPTTHEMWRSTFLFGLFALVPALLLALKQGGVLSGLGQSSNPAFGLHLSSRIVYDTFGSTVVPWDIQFLRDFGLPLLLFPFGFLFAWKKRKDQPVWLILSILGLIHLALPFIVEYRLILGEMRRAFYVSTSVFALLAGVVIDQRLLSFKRRWLKVTGSGFIVAMLLSSAIALTLRLIVPTGRFEKTTFFASLPPVTQSQADLYQWVRENTTQDDYFYVRNLTVDFEELSDEGMQMRDRVLFTTYTGRFTIGPIIYWDYDAEWLALVEKAEKTCDAEAMRGLKVRYLFVENNKDRTEWFTDICNEKDWEMKYEGDGGRIYALRGSDGN